jgi:hypothetical protein
MRVVSCVNRRIGANIIIDRRRFSDAKLNAICCIVSEIESTSTLTYTIIPALIVA